ncbi:E3 ubiquitin-protein ligase UPL4-like [Zingiber officinale]|uniref:HECT domain-containing protein n=1 Tax=Zingiber officinale TaxID=94328 RepID=A0A8J5KUA3_ZINOF|nr:E3 ubiquitin-protein ligase UPL4-like [Zingiber officinale]KAG6496224.1 hypothetical protein ZIOFF_044072 [Zingiber officinale]
MDRSQKRKISDGELPVKKRACRSTERLPVSFASRTELQRSISAGSDRGKGLPDHGLLGSDNRAMGLSKRRVHRVVARLADDGSGESAQLEALTELCEMLSFVMEDAIERFPLEELVPSLLKLNANGRNPEIMLLAIRALTYLLDARPSSAAAIARHGGITVLCGKLLAIEYLDVAEKCHQALEKISRGYPVACLKAGAVNAVLTYIDFFPSNIQRVAVITVTNMCKELSPDYSSIIMEAVPSLCTLLQYENKELVETVSTCLAWVAYSVRYSPILTDELCKHGVLEKSLELIDNDSHRSISSITFSSLVGLLTRLASHSQLAVRILFELSISRTLRGILIGSDMSHNSAYASTEDVQNNQVWEALKLTNQLIPEKKKDVPVNKLIQAKEKILMDEPNFLYQFAMEFLPASIQVVNSGANDYVCYGCISIIRRIAHYSTPEILLDSIKDTNISSFLAGLLSRKDIHLLISTLEIVEILMQKLPGVFLSSFIKEGVFYAIDMLLVQDKCIESVPHSDEKIAVSVVSRCMCFAFTPSSVPPSQLKTCKLGKDAIHNLGGKIKASYYLGHGAANSDMSCSKTLQHLRTLCRVLDDSMDTHSDDVGNLHEVKFSTQILDEVMRELSQGESLSTFEFVESGIARSLAHYLCNGKFLLGIHDSGLSDHILAVQKRFQIFASICLSKPSQNRDDTILACLLKNLQDVLSSLDNFPVVRSQQLKPRKSYTDIPCSSPTMNPCLKVSFVRDNKDSNLLDFDNVLSIDIASSLVDAVEAYLWPKVSAMNRHQSEAVDYHISKLNLRASRLHHDSEGSSTEAYMNISYETYISNSLEVIRSQEEQLLPVKTSSKLTTDTEVAQGRITTVSPCMVNTKPRLTFSLRGKQLDRSKTLYQAVLEDQVSPGFDMIVGSKFWNQTYEFTYRIAEEDKANKNNMLDLVSQSNIFLNRLGFSFLKLPFFPTKLQAEMLSNIDRMNTSYDILFMLKILEGLNQFSMELSVNDRIQEFAEGRIDNFDDLKVIVSPVPKVDFVSSKLTEKLEQQMRDQLVLNTGCFPSWCSQLTSACPFLFSFEARLKYFYLTAFGSLRNQNNNIRHSDRSSMSSGEWHMVTSFHSRKKFKVDRNNILECATKIMKLHAQSKGSLEVEYADEVGTGLGPTMEFYTLVSHEFQKVGLGMWREDYCAAKSSVCSDSSVLFAPCGLFPCPWSRKRSGGIKFSDVKKKFSLLGKLVAKAIKDGRTMDISFSNAFYKIMLEQELNICDIQSFDPDLGRTLLEFQALVNRKKFVESVSGERDKDPSKLYYRSMAVEDLSLDFTLPGYTDYALASESAKMVNIANLEEYVALVIDATIGSGVARQINAFKSGFNEVFPLRYLQIFTEDELEQLLCGEQDTWDFIQLVNHIKFDHGYSVSSLMATNLLEIIQEYDYDQRRAFLQFVTGAPRLAHGGLAALNPKLTVVRKHSSFDADLDLPSVMTCANYLKLPPYSSKEIMRERLLYAITEGQGSFHLS